MRRILLPFMGSLSLVLGLGLQPEAASSAEIEHGKLAETGELSNAYFISITGDIKAGDEEKFRRLSIQYDRAIVVLESDGGQLIPAIEIGKLIRIKEYPTLVLSDSTCTSSCALIWVAGSKRLLAPTARVGFHASYKDVNGRPEETGLGNALVGRYLTLLNLPEKAIIFATAASPSEVLWLTASNMRDAGIEFETFGKEPVSPPPIIRTNTISASKAPQSGWIRVAKGEKVEYFLNSEKILRVGQFISAWEKADHSLDTEVDYYTSLDLWYYDCRNRKMALKAYAEYDKEGRRTDGNEFSDGQMSWNSVVPDSVGETKLGIVCSSGK